LNRKEFERFLKRLYLTYDELASILDDLDNYIRCYFRKEKRWKVLEKFYELCEV